MSTTVLATTVLETAGLSRNFGGLLAVDSVDLAVGKGEIFGIIGPNGAGKSTLFNLIAGVVPPSSGTVSLHGDRVDRLRVHQRCQLGLGRTFQEAQAFEHHTVRECLLSAGASRATGIAAWLGRVDTVEAVDRASALLEELGLADQADRRPSELTNLAQQKLAIGMAVATGCDVLLLDEPSGGLIEAEVAEIASFIQSLRERGMTVVVIDHKMRLMMSLCDRIMVMAEGAVVTVGTPEEVRQHEDVINVYLGRPKAPRTRGAES
jgi:branched-chain amino acid transport system ATP-binding protein